mgnify:CR=1 FL=1
MQLTRTTTVVTTVKFTKDELEDLALSKLKNRFEGEAFDICWSDDGLMFTMEKTK